MDAGHLRQVMPCRQAKFRRHGLQQHGHQIGQRNHPQQVVPKGAAALDIGSIIAGVDIGHTGDKGRPQERKYGKQPLRAPIERRAGSPARPAFRRKGITQRFST